MKFDEGKLLLLLSGILTGVVITSFIIGTSLKPTMFMTYKQYQKMSMEVNQLKNEIQGLNRDYSELQMKYHKYNLSGEKEKSVLETITNELNDVKLFYGVDPVEGQGIKITVRDNNEYSNYFELMDSITHNFDIYNIINELRDGGAEAISVNGYRILSTTAITCGGPTIMLNDDIYVAPPFEILAIGDPNAMEYILNQEESYIQVLKLRGLKLKIEKVSNIRMDGISQINVPLYMKVKR